MLWGQFGTVVVFTAAKLSTKTVKFCTMWKFPAIQYGLMIVVLLPPCRSHSSSCGHQRGKHWCAEILISDGSKQKCPCKFNTMHMWPENEIFFFHGKDGCGTPKISWRRLSQVVLKSQKSWKFSLSPLIYSTYTYIICLTDSKEVSKLDRMPQKHSLRVKIPNFPEEHAPRPPYLEGWCM